MIDLENIEVEFLIMMLFIYKLIAETIHDGFTEQEIVHSYCDLTGDYTTAFNKGKQDEVHKRIKHNQIWG